MGDPEPVPNAAVERVARDAYGRIVAIVARATGDLHAAEDAVSEALAAALRAWPRDGVPARPEAWLVTAARRRLIDASRRDARLVALESIDALAVQVSPDAPLPDERLALLFACAHPALDPAARTPLMLRAVLGLDLERIASTFLVSPAALKQRLTRAKAKIRDAGVRLTVPEPEDFPARLAGVLAAVYAALTAGVDARPDEGERSGRLANEAIHLARVLCDLIPQESEPHGLLALALYCESRRAARVTPGGDFVPLDLQDPRDWDQAMIREAEASLRRATELGGVGRYQVEAAIQSAHVDRRRGGGASWRTIVGLYDWLLGVAPSVGAEVARAGALAESGDAVGALAALDSVALARGDRLATYQPYWAVRGETLRRLRRETEAREALTRAIGLTGDAALRRHLAAKLA